MPEFKFFCPSCGKQIECDTGYCGLQINCPACQQPIPVPPTPSSSNVAPAVQMGSAPGRAKKKLLLLAGIFLVLLLVGTSAGFFLYWEIRFRPVACWHAEGDAQDSTGNNNGILVGNAAFSRGMVGKAFKFGGDGSYVKIPKFQTLNPVKNITIEFWMKADPANALQSYQGLVASDYYGVEISNGFQSKIGVNFYVSSDRGRSWGAVSEANGGGATISAGEWHHIAGTYDGANMVLYIDGEAWGNPASYSGNISPPSRSGFLAIGSEDGRTAFPNCISTRYFNGLIDEVRIYNRALSASEITAACNSGRLKAAN